LAPGRDVDVPAVNLINISTGVIVGAVGVLATAGDDGVRALRPHVGFYVDENKLLWVAEEGRAADHPNRVTYSVFYEIREAGDEGLELYTIQGFELTWDREAGTVASPITTKGGQYRLILTPEEEALRQDFNNHQLRAGHLADLRYRRRLEGLTADEVQDFLDNAEDPALQDYLNRLKEFVEQQAALAAAPVGDRPSITFVMGQEPQNAPNQFYNSATGFFTLNPAGALEGALRSLREVRDHLDNHLPAVQNAAGDQLPWGEINIVVHANAYGGLSIPVLPGDEVAHPVSLQRAVNDGDFQPLSDRVVDSRTVIQMRGCALGNTPEMLRLLSTSFGGTNTRQRPAVRAPKHLQGYAQTTSNHAVVAAEQFYAQYWYVGYPEGQRPPIATLVTKFENKYPGVNVDWNAALHNNLAGYTLERRHFPYIYSFSFTFGDGNVPNLPNDAARLAWLRQESNIDNDLPNSYDEVVDDFEWSFTVNIVNLAGGAKRLEMVATGRQELDRISRNLTMDRRQLFTLALNFAQTLDNRTLSGDLRTAFSDHGHALSAESHTWIRETGARWVIVDPGNVHSYFVELAGQLLNVSLEEDPATLISQPNAHPPTTHPDHFGGEVPAIPAQHPLGENVEP
ncbi:MAG: hypothetical protein KDE58_01380, partial [Caldilineaceae bacterium]|nr:hypothetical protein [Caldilineaceae bacterium]